ncbi:hypothetical protein EWW49_31880, partial [Pseudomonas syringae]
NRTAGAGAGGPILRPGAMSRRATFVVCSGDNHCGALTAVVPGRAAEGFRFTSGLPVQVLKGMAPILTPYLENHGQALCNAPLADPPKGV